MRNDDRSKLENQNSSRGENLLLLVMLIERRLNKGFKNSFYLPNLHRKGSLRRKYFAFQSCRPHGHFSS